METSCDTQITHEGVISLIESGRIEVAISPIAACEGCKARGSCGAVEQQRKIEVFDNNCDEFKVGDKVVVSVRRSTALYATFFAYIVPLIIFVGAIAVVVTVVGAEGLAALVGFGAVALYYSALYLLRRAAERAVHFEIKKKR